MARLDTPDPAALHARAREQGVNRLVYRITRTILVPFFKLYFRLDGVACAHIPAEGGAIIASNHRSFLDPFVIGACASRPLYFVAKKELFRKPWQAWILNSLGAFPVDRGGADEETIITAKAILARGEIVLIFPEGTRIRPGTLGKPKRGVGRLALEAGVPVIPVAVTGTEAIRRGWRIRPHKVRVRAGRALHFPQVERPSPQLAAAVTSRIWPCVALQWEWLGGLAPIRRACVVGAGHWGTFLADSLARAGYDVDLGCHTAEQARAIAETRVSPRRPDVELPPQVNVVPADSLDLYGHDLILLAVPAAALPAVLDAHAALIPPSSGVLVLSRGSVGPRGLSAAAYVGQRCRARALAIAALDTTPEPGGRVQAAVASPDRGFSRQLVDVLKDIGMTVSTQADVAALERQLDGRAVAARAA